MYTGSVDNSGVHVNSGIANKAFYLVAKGGSHHLGGSMTGIGADDASRIWFSALTSYMTPGTNFAGARSATSQAAAAIFGSYGTHQKAVETAWCLVGVGACPPTLLALSVTPGSGMGISQTFTLAYSDSLGAVSDLSAAQVRFVPTDGAPGHASSTTAPRPTRCAYRMTTRRGGSLRRWAQARLPTAIVRSISRSRRRRRAAPISRSRCR